MNILPAVTSILSANELGEFIKLAYNLNESFTCKLIKTGMNHTYIISNNKTKYVVRVYSHNWRLNSEIIEEVNLLKLLKENGIGISFPIADKKGVFIQQVKAPEGLRQVVVFSFAEGGKIRFMDKGICYSFGSLMASIHNVTANKNLDRVNYNLDTLLGASYNCSKTFFPEKLKEMAFIKEQSAAIRKCFIENDKNLSQGIVHLDIWYDNMNITEKNEITIFDFDFCGNGPLILDVAYFCIQLFHIETDKTEYELKLKSFLEGYKNSKTLSKSELELIPSAASAIWIFYLGIQVKRFDWSNVFLSENYLKMYVGRMKSWIEYNSKHKISIDGAM